MAQRFTSSSAGRWCYHYGTGQTPRADLWRMAHPLRSSRLHEGGGWFHVLTAVPQTPCPGGSRCFCFHEWVNLNMWLCWFSLSCFQLEVIKNLDSNELEKISSLSCQETGSTRAGWSTSHLSAPQPKQVTCSPVIRKIGSNSLKSEKIFPMSHSAHFPLVTLSRLGHRRKEAPCNPSGSL